MTEINFKNSGQIFYGTTKIKEAYYGNTLLWTKPNNLTDYYGTGAGQIPIDLDFAKSETDSNGHATVTPNLGGYGQDYRTITNKDPIPMVNGALDIIALRSMGFPTSTPNLLGSRLMFVIQLRSTGVNQFLVGDPLLVKDMFLRSAGTGMNTRRRNEANQAIQTLSYINPNYDTNLALYEIDLSDDGYIRHYINGQYHGISNAPHGYPDFTIKYLFCGANFNNSANVLNALCYRFINILGGADEARLNQIRNELSQKYNIGFTAGRVSSLNLTDTAGINQFTPEIRTDMEFRASRNASTRSYLSFNTTIPSGSRIVMESVGTGPLWVRMADDAALSINAVDILVNGSGYLNINYTVNATRPYFGFLVLNSVGASTVHVKNFAVLPPA